MSTLPPTSSTVPTTPPVSSKRNIWLILGAAVGGGCLVLVCLGVVMIGFLTLLGQRVESAFQQIETELAREALPTPLPFGAVDADGLTQLGLTQNVTMLASEVAIDPGLPGIAPRALHQFLVVSFEISGGSTADVQLTRDGLLRGARLEDAAGTRYPCCVRTLMDARAMNPPVVGTQTMAQVAFEVPAGSSPLFFVQDDPGGGPPTVLQVR